VGVPLIARWPEGIELPAKSVLSQRLHVTDLYPTFLELAGAQYPARDGKRELKPLYGHSITPLFSNASLADTAIHDEVFWSYGSQRGFVQGAWKIHSLNDGPWMLYNVEDDPA
jgi:arylsulfatase